MLTPWKILRKAFGLPFAWTPAAHEDDSTDVLVEGKAYPHANQTIAKGDADDVTQTDGNAPLEDNADDKGIDGVACGAEGATCKDVGCAPDLQEPIDNEHPHTHGDDLRIIGKGTEDVAPEDREK